MPKIGLMPSVGRTITPVTTETIILVLLIATALAFDFTNGFHDTGNAMATSIATGALKPKTAVVLAGRDEAACKAFRPKSAQRATRET